MTRIALIVVPLLLLGACKVNNDKANDQVSIEYNQDLAENVASDVGNTAENIGGIIANDVSATADKVENEVDEHDADAPANNSANAN